MKKEEIEKLTALVDDLYDNGELGYGSNSYSDYFPQSDEVVGKFFNYYLQFLFDTTSQKDRKRWNPIKKHIFSEGKLFYIDPSKVVADPSNIKNAISFKKFKDEFVRLGSCLVKKYNLEGVDFSSGDAKKELLKVIKKNKKLDGNDRADDFYCTKVLTLLNSELLDLDVDFNVEQIMKNGHDMKLCVYYGPPGTGKTTVAKEEHLKKVGKENSQIVQIHPSYSYEDFVEGIRPITFFDGEIKYEVVDGPVKILAKKASFSNESRSMHRPLHLLCCIDEEGTLHFPLGTRERYGLAQIFVSSNYSDMEESLEPLELNSDFILEYADKSEKKRFLKMYVWDKSWLEKKDYVLIIDELNRGNVASILGELVFSLSEVHAEEKKPVRLQYSGEEFYWPTNLSFIGTMNTADTSTDKIDQAIKRRFEFISVDPLESEAEWSNLALNILEGGTIVDFFKGSDVRDQYYPWNILSLLNNKLREKGARYGAIAVREKLIGHSFFIKYTRQLASLLKDNTSANINEACARLLKELFESEVEPSLLNIFNNNFDMLEKFKSEELSRKEFPFFYDVDSIDDTPLVDHKSTGTDG